MRKIIMTEKRKSRETGREAPWPFLGNFAAGNNNTTGTVTVTVTIREAVSFRTENASRAAGGSSLSEQFRLQRRNLDDR